MEDTVQPSYMGELNEDERAMDGLVTEWLSTFLEDKTKQELIFDYHGYPLDHYFKSTREIRSAVWKRKETIYHLDYLEFAIEEVRQKTGAEEEKKKKKPAKLDPADKEVVELLKGYKHELYAALHEFDKQMILGALHVVSGKFVLFDLKKHRKLQEEVEEKFDQVAYSKLDSLYYEEAISHFKEAGTYWNKLDDHELGRMFILQTEDVRDFHRCPRKMVGV